MGKVLLENLDTYKVHGGAFEPSTHLGGPFGVVWRRKKIRKSSVWKNEHSASECVCLWSSDESPSPAGSLRLAGGPKTSAESSNFSPAQSLSTRLHYGTRNGANTQSVSRCSTGTSPGTAAPPPGLSLCLFPSLSDRPLICTASILLSVLFSSPSVCICFASRCQMARTFHLWR